MIDQLLAWQHLTLKVKKWGGGGGAQTHTGIDCLPGGILHHAGTISWLAYVFFIIRDDFSNILSVLSFLNLS